MKRSISILALAALLAAPAAAQSPLTWLGTPRWNSPKGGTGITINADYGRPNTNAGQGYAYGGRVAFGLGTVTLTAGVASWEPKTFDVRAMSYGGTAGFRLVGGTLLPVAVNLQLGGAHNRKVMSGTQTLLDETTTAQGALGVSVPLPTPFVSVEPYFSPGVRYYKRWNVPGADAQEVNFGWVVGGNIGFGPVGVHLAYDSEKFDDGTRHGVFGVGANVAFKVPLGM